MSASVAPVPYHSPTRPVSEALPCWLGTRWPLPDLYLRPTLVLGLWRASLCLQVEPNAFRWCHTSVTEYEVQDLMRDWGQGPEFALARWFGERAPSPALARTVVIQSLLGATAEELGL